MLTPPKLYEELEQRFENMNYELVNLLKNNKKRYKFLDIKDHFEGLKSKFKEV